MAPAEVERRIEQAARKLGRQLKIPGFRKGKVPPPVVIGRLGRQYVLDEALRDSIGAWYDHAIDGAGIAPVGEPEIKVGDLPGDGAPLAFSIEIGVRPVATLGAYRGIEVPRREPAATEEAIDAEIERLRERFPEIIAPRTDDICYATTNRQAAVKELAQACDLVLVIGSRNSSNSNRLVEVARECGAAAQLIDNESEVQEEWLAGMRTVGITSGASAPEELVKRLVRFFRDRGTTDVEELELVREDTRFMLPKPIRQAIA